MSRQFLLDTNLVSEPTRPRPDPRIADWLAVQPKRALHVSAVTIGELRKGLALLAPGKRRSSLEHWFETAFLVEFDGRILPVTHTVADRWGALTAVRQLAGNPLGMADGLIAATALKHELTLVNRNTKHFIGLGVLLLNPWDLQSQTM